MSVWDKLKEFKKQAGLLVTISAIGAMTVFSNKADAQTTHRDTTGKPKPPTDVQLKKAYHRGPEKVAPTAADLKRGIHSVTKTETILTGEKNPDANKQIPVKNPGVIDHVKKTVVQTPGAKDGKAFKDFLHKYFIKHGHHWQDDHPEIFKKDTTWRQKPSVETTQAKSDTSKQAFVDVITLEKIRDSLVTEYDTTTIKFRDRKDQWRVLVGVTENSFVDPNLGRKINEFVEIRTPHYGPLVGTGENEHGLFRNTVEFINAPGEQVVTDAHCQSCDMKVLVDNHKLNTTVQASIDAEYTQGLGKDNAFGKISGVASIGDKYRLNSMTDIQILKMGAYLPGDPHIRLPDADKDAIAATRNRVFTRLGFEYEYDFNKGDVTTTKLASSSKGYQTYEVTNKEKGGPFVALDLFWEKDYGVGALENTYQAGRYAIPPGQSSFVGKLGFGYRFK
jgi:hypothetical protein